MGLDFSHTCPKIDKAISEAKDTIIDYLKDYITDLCPYISDEKANELSKDWGTDLYDKISGGFEATRETNEDMRKEADRQIDYAEAEIKDLNARIEELKGQVSELESELDAVS
jgi:chromosome segregation ATPase